MANQKTYHVVPDNGGWRVRKEGARTGMVYGRKSDAIAKAREMVRHAIRGQIIIHDKSGRIQTEHTYGVIERVRNAFTKTVSAKDIKKLPRDAAAHHDKYIYGKDHGRR